MNFRINTVALATASLFFACSPAAAVAIFSDNFDTYQAGGTASQVHTGLNEGAFGTLGAWYGYGANAVHAVDRTGAGDWAPMLYAGPQGYNSIRTKSTFAANTLGVNYQVSFDSAAAAFGSDSEGTSASEFLQFNLLRGDGSVVYQYLFKTANWTGSAINPFTSSAFTYTGDGTGDVYLLIDGISQNNSSRFGGAVDNVSVSGVPEPTSWTMMLAGFGAVGYAMRRQRKMAFSI